MYCILHFHVMFGVRKELWHSLNDGFGWNAGMINQAPTKDLKNSVIRIGAFPREDLVFYL